MNKLILILPIIFMANKLNFRMPSDKQSKQNIVCGNWLTTSCKFDTATINKKEGISFGETLALRVMGYGKTTPYRIEIWDVLIVYCNKNKLQCDTAKYEKVSNNRYTSLQDTFQLTKKGNTLTYKNRVFTAKFKRE